MPGVIPGMPRVARSVIPHVPHRVTRRGDNRQDVFFAADGRHTYFAMLRGRCDAAGVRVLGCCFTTNHVHLIIVPPPVPQPGWASTKVKAKRAKRQRREAR